MRRTLPRHTPSNSTSGDSSLSSPRGTPLGTPRSEKGYGQAHEAQSSYFAEKAPFLGRSSHSRGGSLASPGSNHGGLYHSPRHSISSSPQAARLTPRWTQVASGSRAWKRTTVTVGIPLLLVLLLGSAVWHRDDIQAKVDPDGSRVQAVGEAWKGVTGSVHGWWSGAGTGHEAEGKEEETYNSSEDPEEAKEAETEGEQAEKGAVEGGLKGEADDVEEGGKVEEETQADEAEDGSDKDVKGSTGALDGDSSSSDTPPSYEDATLSDDDASAHEAITKPDLISPEDDSQAASNEPPPAKADAPIPAAAPAAVAGAAAAVEWDAKAKHFVSLLPTIPDRKPDDGEKFLGYLPHSGFHNQRIELQNAFALAAALNRTLLVPPIWIGWTWPWDKYSRLQEAWDFQLENHGASFGGFPPITASTSADGAELGADKTGEDCKAHTAKCRKSFKDTFMSWDYLSNIEEAAGTAGVKIMERFNVSEARAWELAGVKSQEEVLILSDDDSPNAYKYIYQSELDQKEMVQKVFWKTKYTHSVSIPILAQQPQKLILVGTLFGSTRLRLAMPPGQNQYTHLLHPIARSLVFDAPLLLKPTNAIANLLGGEKMSFVGAHLRVGDGIFKHNAPQSVQVVWEGILNALGMDKAEAEKLVQKQNVEAKKVHQRMEKRLRSGMVHGKRAFSEGSLLEERGDWAFADDLLERDERDAPLAYNHIVKRGPAAVLPPAALSPKLRCHAPLHTDPSLLPLNHPIYLATDAPHARANPLLARLWATFPCIFTWDDFTALAEGDKTVQDEIAFGADMREELSGVRELKHSVNMYDGVELGRLFTPFMEAMVAAKGAMVMGTPGSTFSGFATGEMHAVYRARLTQQLKDAGH